MTRAAIQHVGAAQNGTRIERGDVIVAGAAEEVDSEPSAVEGVHNGATNETNVLGAAVDVIGAIGS